MYLQYLTRPHHLIASSESQKCGAPQGFKRSPQSLLVAQAQLNPTQRPYHRAHPTAPKISRHQGSHLNAFREVFGALF